MHNIAIIGSGPTAIYTAHYLLAQSDDVNITIFEAQAEAGKGTPYHQDWNASEMLSNIASIEIPPITQTLMGWLIDKDDDDLARMGIERENITDRTFFPRIALGEYFQAQLKNLVQKTRFGQSSLTVKISHKVTDVRVTDKGIKVFFSNHNQPAEETLFDYVVMATGHAWPKETQTRPGYFLSPWPASALKKVPHCHVGIRGTSLSAIDALVALSVARGSFRRDSAGVLHYFPEAGTEAFHATLMSRKGILPEADFYHPVPYTKLHICTLEAVESLIESSDGYDVLDSVFALFKAELIHCDPDYARRINLHNLTLEEFAHVYFNEREQHDVFVWAERNLAEARSHQALQYTVPWRYAILRMHEIIAIIVPVLTAEDHERFNAYFKPVFVDDYATVPHESIERLLALHRAGKLDVIKLGDNYTIDTQTPSCGAILSKDTLHIHFPAFIEAMGQRALSVHDFPFPSLWQQGLVHNATSPFLRSSYGPKRLLKVGGIALDIAYHPVSNSRAACRLYCLSLPFMLGQFPFAQGITSSHDMGKKVAEDMIHQFTTEDFIIDMSAFTEISSAQKSAG